MRDHDQRWKTLLREFFADFLRLFFPEWARLMDFSHTEWLDKEVFPDPPEGRRRVLDLVARVGLNDEGQAAQGLHDELLALVHVEIESGGSSAPIHDRMPRYYFHLRETHGIPVLPIVLFLDVGLGGIGVQEYSERFGSLETFCFRYLSVGLPALDGVEYLDVANVLAVAMSPLMRVPDDRRPWFKAEALQRIAQNGPDDFRRYLLAECVDAYLPLLDEREQAEFQRLMAQTKYEEAKSMSAPTIFEDGMNEGQRSLVLLLLEERFGSISESVRETLREKSGDELRRLARQLLHAQSLSELGLDS
jgi:hypothetical protein